MFFDKIDAYQHLPKHRFKQFDLRTLIVMIFAGMIYAWPVMAKSIGATYPEWSAAQLSLTFTLVVAFICVSVMVVGAMSKKIAPRGCIMISGILLMGFAAGAFIIVSAVVSVAVRRPVSG